MRENNKVWKKKEAKLYRNDIKLKQQEKNYNFRTHIKSLQNKQKDSRKLQIKNYINYFPSKK